MEAENNTLEDWIAKRLAERGWTTRELARRSGLAHTTINNVLNGTRRPGWDFCARIAEPLGTTPIEVFIQAGKLTRTQALTALSHLLAERQADIGRQIAAAAQPLSAEEQEFLLQMIQAVTLRREGGRGKG